MRRKPQPAPFDGALVIDKPQGKTSHDIVDAVRHIAGMRQIGHLGTLDPLATGVLVLLLGKATRFVQFYTGRRKRYLAGYRFGFATDTYDADGEAQGPDSPVQLDAALLEAYSLQLRIYGLAARRGLLPGGRDPRLILFDLRRGEARDIPPDDALVEERVIAAAARIAAGDFRLGPEHAQRPCTLCAYRPICTDARKVL